MTKLALQRPVFIFILMLLAILGGLVSYQSMRKEQNPEVNFGTLTVTTLYPGAGPDDINQLISRKVEEAVAGVNGVREVQATSQEGVSTVIITLELGVNSDNALNDVRTKVDAIQNDLPTDARKPVVSKFDNSAQPILTLGVTSKSLNPQKLRDLIDDKIRDRFTQIPGVASANVAGGDIREVQIRIKKDKLMQYGIGITDVLNSVTGAAVNTPSGKFISGDREFTVRVKSDFTEPADAEKVVIRVQNPTNPQAKANQIRLTDVAEIVDSVKERTQITRLNGKEAVVVNIQKTKEGNAVEITEKMNEILPEIEKEYGLTITKTFQEATLVEEALTDVTFALVFGIILVGIIVYVFLHNFRGTLIVSLAIPTSMMAAFIAMKAAGFTINTLSMLALSLAIGVLVDDAIVVLENIYRHLKMGEDPSEAALNGRQEIGVAALAITLADVVVFLPIGFAGGITGQFFKPLALTYVFAVLFSLFVSFTLTPLLAARWYRKGENVEHYEKGFPAWFEKRFHRFEMAYRRGLERALKNRWTVFAGGNALLVAVFIFIGGGFAGAAGGPAAGFKMGFPMLGMSIVIGVIASICNLVFYKRRTIRPVIGGVLLGLLFPIAGMSGAAFQNWKQDQVFKFSFLPSTDATQITAAIELPVGTNLAETEKVTALVEKAFIKHPDMKFTVTNVGRQSGSSFGGETNATNFAEVVGTMYEKEAILDRVTGANKREKLRTVRSGSIVADLTQAVGQIPGASIRIAANQRFAFGSAVQVSLTSENRELLEQTANKVREVILQGKVPGIIKPELSSKSGKPEIRVKPDYRKAADLGVNASDIGNALRTMYQGNDDVKLRVGGREYAVRVMMDYADRDKRETLSTVPIKFTQGNPVFLSTIADLNPTPGLSKITRRNRAEEIIVNADLLPGVENGTVNAALKTYLETNKIVPEGVNFRLLGQADAQARETGFLMSAFVTGILLVYFVLAALYNNWLYPFIIQLAQPQAMVGALLALIITDKAFSLIGFIGLVALVGLVGKNAILVVDYTNTLRERGRARHDAILEAGPTRLRPIMMTTLALLLGTLPTALAIGRGSEFRESIGITVIGGVLLSTFLTLFVIPASYTIFDDVSNMVAKLMKKPLPFGGTEGFVSTAAKEGEEEPATVS